MRSKVGGLCSHILPFDVLLIVMQIQTAFCNIKEHHTALPGRLCQKKQFVCASLTPCLPFYVCVPVCVPACVLSLHYLYFFIFLVLSVCVSVCILNILFAYWSTCLSVCMIRVPLIFLYVFLTTHLAVSLSSDLCLSICLPSRCSFSVSLSLLCKSLFEQ
jgi:hypothetical protein